jgi:hypothetical protein
MLEFLGDLLLSMWLSATRGTPRPARTGPDDAAEQEPTRADAERAIRGDEQEPKFKHQWVWVTLMWIAIGLFAIWYWQHPGAWGLATHRK